MSQVNKSRWVASTAVVAGLLLLVPLLGADQAEGDPPAESTPADDADSLAYEKWKTTVPGTYGDYNQRANLAQRGRIVYDRYCVGCHGENGDGDGPASARLQTKPRDFGSGIYKFRSTDSGSLPMEADLYRTITRGLSRVSMPAFPLMPENEKLAVIEYIKGFYARWEDEKAQRVLVAVPRAPRDLDDRDRILRGRFVYLEMQCTQCHGVDGQGTGATQTEYVDAWGNAQLPFNFTKGSLKGGNAPEDIYRTFHSGLRSIMPSYGGETLAYATRETYNDRRATLDSAEVAALDGVADDFPATAGEVSGLDTPARVDLATRNSWDLVAYIQSLRTQTTTAAAVLGQPQPTDQ